MLNVNAGRDELQRCLVDRDTSHARDHITRPRQGGVENSTRTLVQNLRAGLPLKITRREHESEECTCTMFLIHSKLQLKEKHDRNITPSHPHICPIYTTLNVPTVANYPPPYNVYNVLSTDEFVSS